MIIVLAVVLALDTPYAELVVTPKLLLANPSSYAGQQIGVSGTVESLELKTSQGGNDYESFKLCDRACIIVFTWGHPALRDGQSETVHGTFATVRHVGSDTYHNVVIADATWAKQCCSE